MRIDGRHRREQTRMEGTDVATNRLAAVSGGTLNPVSAELHRVRCRRAWMPPHLQVASGRNRFTVAVRHQL